MHRFVAGMKSMEQIKTSALEGAKLVSRKGDYVEMSTADRVLHHAKQRGRFDR